MGNLDFSANADQLKELATYMASQINVPTIGIGGGYAPIGSINFFDATTAPQDWLACDGTVYNIADYPQLADYYEAQHGSKNFYGGDGTTTFAVPDLQGEFLRGTGTNGHTRQGNGASVGVHQDGTEHVGVSYGNGDGAYLAVPSNSGGYNTPSKLDSQTSTTKTLKYGNSVNNESTVPLKYTSRPTNTSFLICVKAVVAGEVYSTEERVVGTWIDGKKIYQKVISFTVSSSHTSITSIPTGITNGTMGFVVGGYVHSTGGNYLPINSSDSDTVFVYCGCTNDASNLRFRVSAGIVGTIALVIIRYTKTTD